MNRGVFGFLGSAFTARLNAASAAAAEAQATATAARTAGQNAETSATNLATAVSAGNQAHTLLNARLDSINIGTGRVAAALLLGASVDIVVTFATPMPTNDYIVKVAPTTGFTFGTPKGKTTTTVTIPVTAALALALGQTFTVIAYIP